MLCRFDSGQSHHILNGDTYEKYSAMKNLHLDLAPECSLPGCTKKVAYHKKLVDKDGNVSYTYKSFCSHHKTNVVGKKAMKAFKLRKGGCENTDGRCGFVCDAPNQPWYVLEIDHWDGNRYNTDEDNLVVLCPCCHKKKGYMFGDHLKKKYTPESPTLYDKIFYENFIIEV